MKNEAKPDDRNDNVERIQDNIDMTIKNIHFADDMIDKTNDKKMKKELTEKNKRRENALKGMRSEIREEANYAKNIKKKEKEIDTVSDLYDN
jgi:small acid-soluble spore protein (thioredoxin-like protein)